MPYLILWYIEENTGYYFNQGVSLRLRVQKKKLKILQVAIFFLKPPNTKEDLWSYLEKEGN